MAYYRDIRELIQVLEKQGKLQRIRRKMVKETETGPLFWLQFRGLPEDEWKAFLYENVVDVQGKKCWRVLLGPYASSREILAMGLKCLPEEINEKWCSACAHPLEPEIVPSGPVQEVIIKGEELGKRGLEQIPAIVEVPGFAGTVRTTTQFFTKDPDSGIRNVGCYSGHIFGPQHMTWGIAPPHHGYIQWQRARAKGKTLQVAIVIGSTTNFALVSAAPLAYQEDEVAVAGGLVGEPVKLVKCQTVDLEVPANAEIVIEGEVSNEFMEPHSAFGDYPGYVYEPEGALRPSIKVTCITHRKDPIFNTTTVGYAPNDAIILSAVAREVGLYKHLKYDCYIPGLLDVALPQSGGASNYCVVQIKKTSPWEPWQVLNALAGYDPGLGKITVVVDEDIDPRDEHAVNWALSYSMQPHKDVRIITQRTPRLDPSGYPPGASNEERRFPTPVGASAMLIDATRKWPYAPVGLPRKDFMEKAMKTWEELEFPKLRLKKPWHGYHLGRWTPNDEENAQLALQGKHFQVGDKMTKGRVKL